MACAVNLSNKPTWNSVDKDRWRHMATLHCVLIKRLWTSLRICPEFFWEKSKPSLSQSKQRLSPWRWPSTANHGRVENICWPPGGIFKWGSLSSGTLCHWCCCAVCNMMLYWVALLEDSLVLVGVSHRLGWNWGINRYHGAWKQPRVSTPTQPSRPAALGLMPGLTKGYRLHVGMDGQNLTPARGGFCWKPPRKTRLHAAAGWNQGAVFNITTSFYQYENSHYEHRTVMRLSYLNMCPYTGKTMSLYWNDPLLSRRVYRCTGHTGEWKSLFVLCSHAIYFNVFGRDCSVGGVCVYRDYPWDWQAQGGMRGNRWTQLGSTMRDFRWGELMLYTTDTITVGQRKKVTAVTFFRCPTVTIFKSIFLNENVCRLIQIPQPGFRFPGPYNLKHQSASEVKRSIPLHACIIQVSWVWYSTGWYSSTVKPVCNDHYDKTYYLWFVQKCVITKTEDANLL